MPPFTDHLIIWMRLLSFPARSHFSIPSFHHQDHSGNFFTSCFLISFSSNVLNISDGKNCKFTINWGEEGLFVWSILLNVVVNFIKVEILLVSCATLNNWSWVMLKFNQLYDLCYHRLSNRSVERIGIICSFLGDLCYELGISFLF